MTSDFVHGFIWNYFLLYEFAMSLGFILDLL